MSRKIKIFDTTLRDGEQSPGCSMNLNEKMKIARQLELLKVDVIEAGFAISSPGDFEAVQSIAKAIRNCTIASLSRAVKKDIEASAEALKPAADPCIHTFLATSPIHMEYKLKMSPEDVLQQAGEMVRYARNFCEKVEFSAEDATRSDPEFLARVIERAIQEGATVVNIPDTVGYITPEEMGKLISYLKEHVPNIDKADLSVHCHNDLGMAVANSFYAATQGVTQIECAINGIGERAGNCSLEEIVMGIKTRGERFGMYTEIDCTQLYRTSRMLSRIIGVNVPPNKAIVGKNAFAHEAGIHQHGVMANPLTYEIMTPESVGIVRNAMVLGKHSGRHAFEDRLKELGYILTPEELEKAFAQFKILCDRKKEVTDYDIEALVDNRSQTEQHYKLERFVVNSGNTINSTASLKLDYDGKTIERVAIGDGPVDACFKAVEQSVDMPITLEDYKIRSVSEGEDALGEVSVKIKSGDRMVTGRGLSTDVVESSILAFLHGVNKLVSAGVKA